MKTVFQDDDCGCWLAVASMLSGVAYGKLKDEFTFRDDVTGRSATPLIDLLTRHNVQVEPKSTRLTASRSLQMLKCDALVYGKVHFRAGSKNRFKISKKPTGHWVVWDSKEKVVRDPAGFDGGMILELRNFRRVFKRP